MNVFYTIISKRILLGFGVLVLVLFSFASELSAKEEKESPLDKARHFVEKEDFKSALKILLEYEKTAPEDDLLFYRIGLCYFRLGEDKNAQTYLKKAIQLNPNHPIYHDLLGATYYISGNRTEAEKSFLNCVALEPNSPNALTMLGLLYSEKQDFEKAKDFFSKALALNPEDATANFNLGRIYFNEEDWSNAKKHLGSAYSQDPDGYPVVSLLLETSFRLKEFSESDKYRKDLFRIRNQSQDPRIKSIKYFRFDSFLYKDFIVVARESFQKEGDLFYYYVFSVYDREGKLVREINLESSSFLKERGLEFIIGMNVPQSGAVTHSTSNIAFTKMPPYDELRTIVSDIIDGKVHFPASSSSK
ncbi:tetratricopeptide repeat protein [Leptospira wolffii]|uniref:tetratricopeptide repeat protein n=1 Tax=Leptospira wolffii TaxID=409998 RepID=UPI000345343B|nr:tetratricopeptide repeat protein [Leptospira wolffii]TGK55184.1 tetratricopeptide repeat protein [Leptospira wolffii]TGK70515.1 tetratricopeptide repeat protein [Leptospira wolffii]TGK77637.1 tetratricopeptide repeat protein [Leptospira wolffii]TGL29948.1 tetratricopeptide repeat protein [Leptospira wolffii]